LVPTFVATIALALFAVDASAATRPFRVCAEPDNMPLSNARGEGFENRIAAVLADELRADLVVAWQPQRRGFIRKTIGADLCDVWIGVPVGFERLLTTRPYYRSGYVIVTRADAAQPLRTLTDPRIASLRIGVQLVGDDLAATPPGLALARAGALEGVVGYPVYGEGSTAARISADLGAGRIDAAIVWGPQAGWFVRHGAVPLALAPAPAPEGFAVPFAFAISVGVAKSRPDLRDEIDAALARRARDVRAILDEYGVPQLDASDRPLALTSSGGTR
jgi:quinoprotein dehydrogenase-associated probable ABC transporter substrate-binding protein